MRPVLVVVVVVVIGHVPKSPFPQFPEFVSFIASSGLQCFAYQNSSLVLHLNSQITLRGRERRRGGGL